MYVCMHVWKLGEFVNTFHITIKLGFFIKQLRHSPSPLQANMGIAQLSTMLQKTVEWVKEISESEYILFQCNIQHLRFPC